MTSFLADSLLCDLLDVGLLKFFSTVGTGVSDFPPKAMCQIGNLRWFEFITGRTKSISGKKGDFLIWKLVLPTSNLSALSRQVQATRRTAALQNPISKKNLALLFFLHLFCFSCFSRDLSGEHFCFSCYIHWRLEYTGGKRQQTHLRLEQDEQCREEDDGHHQPTPQAGATFLPSLPYIASLARAKRNFPLFIYKQKEGAFIFPAKGW